jgi:hypothetical protein
MNHCADANNPYYVWSFLPGNAGTLASAVSSCTPSPTFDCASPQNFACYLLKTYGTGLDWTLSYDKSDFLSVFGDYTTDPCAVTELLK